VVSEGGRAGGRERKKSIKADGVLRISEALKNLSSPFVRENYFRSCLAAKNANVAKVWGAFVV
jgi:hypothetical protein